MSLVLKNSTSHTFNDVDILFTGVDSTVDWFRSRARFRPNNILPFWREAHLVFGNIPIRPAPQGIPIYSHPQVIRNCTNIHTQTIRFLAAHQKFANQHRGGSESSAAVAAFDAYTTCNSSTSRGKAPSHITHHSGKITAGMTCLFTQSVHAKIGSAAYALAGRPSKPG